MSGEVAGGGRRGGDGWWVGGRGGRTSVGPSHPREPYRQPRGVCGVVTPRDKEEEEEEREREGDLGR